MDLRSSILGQELNVFGQKSGGAIAHTAHTVALGGLCNNTPNNSDPIGIREFEPALCSGAQSSNPPVVSQNFCKVYNWFFIPNLKFILSNRLAVIKLFV